VAGRASRQCRENGDIWKHDTIDSRKLISIGASRVLIYNDTHIYLRSTHSMQELVMDVITSGCADGYDCRKPSSQSDASVAGRASRQCRENGDIWKHDTIDFLEHTVRDYLKAAGQKL
jgi:hypothetical protein